METGITAVDYGRVAPHHTSCRKVMASRVPTARKRQRSRSSGSPSIRPTTSSYGMDRAARKPRDDLSEGASVIDELVEWSRRHRSTPIRSSMDPPASSFADEIGRQVEPDTSCSPRSSACRTSSRSARARRGEPRLGRRARRRRAVPERAITAAAAAGLGQYARSRESELYKPPP